MGGVGGRVIHGGQCAGPPLKKDRAGMVNYWEGSLCRVKTNVPKKKNLTLRECASPNDSRKTGQKVLTMYSKGSLWENAAIRVGTRSQGRNGKTRGGSIRRAFKTNYGGFRKKREIPARRVRQKGTVNGQGKALDKTTS